VNNSLTSRLVALALALAALAASASAQTTSDKPSAPIKWGAALRQKPEWYAGAEAARVADNLLLYQRDAGGWPKNIDMASPLSEKEKAELVKQKGESDSDLAPTIDNGATYTQLEFLARVYTAQRLERHREAFVKGLDYLLAAQYENGGWPQYYPLRHGYYTHITYNDDAMVGVLELLRDVARKKTAYAFVDEARRLKSEKAVERGVECILKTQVVADGKLTVERADARVVKSIESAVAWFKASQLSGIRWVETPDASKPGRFERTVVKDPNAPPLWARFYEIGTNRPVFEGRDQVIRYSVAEIEPERRNGYGWYTDEPAKLLGKDYPAWQKRAKNQTNEQAK
jgi:hypothetical protein